MAKSYVTELTTAANMLPAIRRTLEEFAVEINRLEKLVAARTEPEVAEEATKVAEEAAKVAEEGGVVVKTEEAAGAAELELGL